VNSGFASVPSVLGLGLANEAGSGSLEKASCSG
jgi:hypothetical protein